MIGIWGFLVGDYMLAGDGDPKLEVIGSCKFGLLAKPEKNENRKLWATCVLLDEYKLE